ncbi:MAG: hypothetical protein AAFQ95_26255 [Cyanobacteria bacterium J06621_3]
MEPITLAIAALTAVATGITAGATGEIGKPLGEGVVAAAKRWLERLNHHSPETVQRLAAVSDPNVIDVEILEEIEQVAAAQPDVQAAMNETAVAAAAESGSFPNLTKLADKIATVNLGNITTQNNTYNF